MNVLIHWLQHVFSLAHEMREENRNAQPHFLDGQKLGRRRLADPHTQQNIVIIFSHQFKPCNHIEPGTIVLKNVGEG